MATSKLATRSAFQIFFKRARFPFRSERNGGFDSPWPVLRSIWTFTLIVFEQALFEITRNAGVVDRLVCLADENVNVEKEHRTVQEQGATIAEFKKEIANLTATVKEQAAQIQKVSAQVELSKPAPRTVLNNNQ